MTEVFLSYSRADRPIAEALALELGRLDIEVWWDLDLLGETTTGAASPKSSRAFA